MHIAQCNVTARKIQWAVKEEGMKGERALAGLPTLADEIPGDFFESLEIPGVFRFAIYANLPSQMYDLFLVVFHDLTKFNLWITSHFIQV